jgi:hypothetical protein
MEQLLSHEDNIIPMRRTEHGRRVVSRYPFRPFYETNPIHD